MFDERSRYAGQPTRERSTPAGRRVVHVLPRLAPPPDAIQHGARHLVTDSDRLDGLAFRHLGTPEAWWMIADANRAMHPAEVLATTGAEIAIPLPAVPGARR
ncbi:hypothetical protein [Falsiroseomonas sp.]|uniref:hypothetical protein n=1 Tax=Falsiroseomonas sp. TaxID=2870721 RepID=UPI00271D4841|nr:hypothetical protein [Falsiroseomonas sp.]MDO9498776.1 hypothetical protein [Falsiroseomonas sp.]